jgi:hypothetical protein
MSKALPERPNLENLKNQAKTLLKSHSSGDSDVCTLLRRLHRFSRSSDQDILSSDLSLAEAQYALAMDYGFSSWDALKQAVKGQEDQKRFLHLQCGDISAESLRRSGIPGRVEVWYDGFIHGPVPADVPQDEFIRLRASSFSDRFEATESGISFFTEMRRRLDDFEEYQEVVMWFDACLFDQTILIHHLDHYSRRYMGKTKLSLICIGEFPGIPRFKGLGQLRPEQTATLLEKRHQVTRQEIDLGVEAWNAYRSPDPAAIENLLLKDTSALPYLAGAFRRHLERFPSVKNGLNREEQESLEVISQGTSAFSDIYARVSDMEDPPFFWETLLLEPLVKMANAPQPLLVMEGREHIGKIPMYEWPFKQISFTLTDTGRDVMNGNADWIRINGIDQWLGGVHLQGTESPWRWDEDNGRLVAY